MTWLLLILALLAIDVFAIYIVGYWYKKADEYRQRFKTVRAARDHWYQVAHNLNRQRGDAVNDRNRSYVQRDNALQKLDAMEADVVATVGDGDVERLKKWAS